jgi:UDPglucose 6-dehydrogenase
MKITMIGTGYVGLVTGACFSELGHDVTCMDTDMDKIMELSEGIIPIYEPRLENLVQKGMQEERLHFTYDVKSAVESADVVFIAVGTPTSRRGDGYADLIYVYSAAQDIAKYITGYTVIVNKSTVPVGTARQVARFIAEKCDAGIEGFDVVSNPEFLREGAAIEDFMRPDRIVIGADNKRAFDMMRKVYKPLYLRDAPIVEMSPETAELTKYASNALLATKISFINEMAQLCEQVGADVSSLAKAVGMDGRIGPKFLHPGPGYGGSCFPKDTLALLSTAQEHGVALRIVSATAEANNSQKARMIKKIKDAVGGDVSDKTFAVLGLTFKPDTDDVRESAALTIVPALAEKGAIIRAHDPKGIKEAIKKLPNAVQYVANAYEAAEGADCVVLITEWSQYRALNLERLVGDMKPNPVFVDLRNVYEKEEMEEVGFAYIGNGRV